MKKDNFYIAVLSIIQEQGIDEARAYLIRRGYSEESANDYLCNVQIELQNSTKSDDCDASVFQSESESNIDTEPKEPKVGFFNRLFGIK